jgi:ubiquinone/menaquinone biosynthesis C-methylase UbiE
MKSGLERAPVYPNRPVEPLTIRQEESVTAFDLIQEHLEWIESFLALKNEPFKTTPADLEARRQQLQVAKELCHRRVRSIADLGKLVIGTVSQMEAEFAYQTVLDIGAGEGRFGEALARKAKARVTFVDNDPNVMDHISPRAGVKVVADGKSLPFEDESFNKTVSAFSSIHWAATPVESVQALNEALRVTEVDGSAFIIPAISNFSKRYWRTRPSLLAWSGAELPDKEEYSALKVWAAQDYVLLKTLLKMAKDDYCAITWSGYRGIAQHYYTELEWVSVIVDKKKAIPTEVLEDNVAYAKQFIEE